MENILNNKNLLRNVFQYLEISDFLNLELTNSGIKSCVDFFYEKKNDLLEINKIEKSHNGSKPSRRNSKLNKQNITKFKKNFISRYINSFVAFGINEEFDEEENFKDNINSSKIDDNEFFSNKQLVNQKKNLNCAIFHKNSLSLDFKDLSYFFNQELFVTQVFYSNEKLFVLYNNSEVKVFPQDANLNFSSSLSLVLMEKNIKKILYDEETGVLFALSEDGNIFKSFYPSEKNIKIFNLIEKEQHKTSLLKKRISKSTNSQYEEYLCFMLKMSSDGSFFTDIYLMKNYLIFIDKTYNIHYLDINNLKTFLIDFEKIYEIIFDDKILNQEDVELNNDMGSINLDNFSQNMIILSNYDTNNETNKIINKDLEGNLTNNILKLLDQVEINNNSEISNEEDMKGKGIKEDNEESSMFNLNPASLFKTNFKDISVKLYQNHGKIIKIDCSESNLLFSDEEQKLFYVPLTELSKDILKSPKSINDTKLTNIIDISCSDGHFMILEREDTLPFEKWTEQDIFNWFKEMNLDDYLNIIKYEKIKGIDLIKANDAYFLNNMGMEDDVISKVKYEINKFKNNSSCKGMKLWGWGANKNGQLGQMDYNKSYLKNLTRINIPDFKEETDFIVSIKCLKNYSVFLSKFGEIYITGNYSIKKKAEDYNLKIPNINQTNYNNLSNNHTKDKKNKRDRKDSNANSVNAKNSENNQLQKPNHRWVNITKRICFDVVKDNNSDDFRQNLFFKAKFFITTNNQLLVFGYKSYSVPFTLQDKLPKLKHFKKGEKFPTSDSIIEQILKKTDKNKEKFLIVYDDAKLKFLEKTLLQYIESDVPYHKILQIKYYNEIIWDRKKRYYKYDY